MNEPQAQTPLDGAAAADGGLSSSDLGERLGAQTQRLHLLFRHLAGPAVRSRVEVEDVVQEVFLRALVQPGRLPPSEPGEAPLAAYLGRVLRHAVIDIVRALRAGKRDRGEVRLDRSSWSRAGSASILGPPASGPGPATRVDLRETEGRLVEAYGGLEPEYRRVIGLRQFEGLSAREVGLRMGRGEAAIHSLYRRALLAWEAAAAP